MAAQTPLAVPVNAQLGAVLHQQWSAAEGAFLEGLLRLFVQLRGEQEHYPAHFAGEWAGMQCPSSKKMGTDAGRASISVTHAQHL